MGNILFFVQNTVSVDGQNSSSKFTVRVKVRADLQAAATEQTLSRSIPLAVRIAGLERISFQPQLCPLQCFVVWAWERVPLFQVQILRWQIPTLPMPLDAGFEQGHLNDARHSPAQAWTFLRW